MTRTTRDPLAVALTLDPVADDGRSLAEHAAEALALTRPLLAPARPSTDRRRPPMPARPVRLTKHARAVMAARRVSVDDVLAAVGAPEVTEPHHGLRRYVRGGLAVVVAPGRHREAVVVTVLLRSGDVWTDADARAREGVPA